MLSRVFIVCSCLFVLAGCAYNDEPMPQIVYDYTLNNSVSPAIFEPAETHVDIGENIPAGWLPPSYLENKKRWRWIVIHHSFPMVYGSAADIDRLHRKRGFDGLGYHFVIDNGGNDGLVEVGSRWEKQKHGAHCRVDKNDDNYWNEHGIGICLVGNFNGRAPSEKQMQSAARLVARLMADCNIPLKNILGHGQVPGASTDCPGKSFPYRDLFRRIAELQGK